MPFFIVTLYAMEDILLPSKFSQSIKSKGKGKGKGKSIGEFLKYILCFGVLIGYVALSRNSHVLAEVVPVPKDLSPPSSFMNTLSLSYDNKIPDFTHVEPYTEVCFKMGSTLVDRHLDKGHTGTGFVVRVTSVSL